jgi:branched-chain amino acid transport system ATP-binding protein
MVVDEIFGSIRQMKQRGIAVLLVEQNARRALDVSDRACIIERGKATATGDARDWLKNDAVRQLLAV